MPDKLAIIINKEAKNAALAAPYLEGLQQAGINFSVFHVDSSQLASTIESCIATYNFILVGGGDGTIRTAAQYCMETTIILGILPLGTMNHFATELQLPATSDSLIKAIQLKKTMTIDIAEVNGLKFINNSSIGFYPKLAKKRDYYKKFYNKWLCYIPSFIEAFRYHPTFSLHIMGENLNFFVRTSFFMVSNNLYTYQFPLQFRRTKFNDHLLGIYFFKFGKLRIIKILRTLFSKKNNFDVKQTTYPFKVEIKNQTQISISLDGDTTTTSVPLYFKIVPQSLRILIKE